MKYLQNEIDIDVAISELENLYNQSKKLENDSKIYNHYQNTLGLAVSRFDEVETTVQESHLRYLMWKSLKEWKELTKGWIDGKFNQIDTEEIRQKAEFYCKIMQKCEKKLP